MNIVANTIVPLCFSCSKGITWCVSLVFVSQTSWCLAGSVYKMFHPRHSMDLWQGSTQHRPSHTHCSGEGEPGQCQCLNPDTVVAVRTQSGGTYFKRGFQDCHPVRLQKFSVTAFNNIMFPFFCILYF